MQTDKEKNERAKKTQEELFPGYIQYPSSDDIYSQSKEESEIDPEDLTKLKQPNEKLGMRNEKDFSEDFDGADLDIPGAELDDEQENIGNEDEENNYYSLGGDDHNDLEESKTDT